MKPLFLIGFMACGKTTLGQALASHLPGTRFVDLDAAVEAHSGCRVADIFQRYGEPYFRQLESDMLRRVATPDTIVACGGGTPCLPENMDYMLARGIVVWLQTDLDTTMRRLRLTPGQRPKVDALLDRREELADYIIALMDLRADAYGRAHHIFDSSRLETEEEIENSVRTFINTIDYDGNPRTS